MSTAPHPQLLLQQAMEDCRREKTLATYLACVDLAGKFDIGEKVLPAMWHDTDTEVLVSSNTKALIETLEMWLTRHKFVPEDFVRWRWYPGATDEEYEQARQKLLDRSDVEPQNDLATALIKDAVFKRGLEQEDRDNIENANRSYAAFRPAWEVEEFLQQYFPQDQIDDPGVVIGRYVRKMYPASTPPEPTLHWYPDDEVAILEKSWIHSLVSQICLSLCNLLQLQNEVEGDDKDYANAFELMSLELATLSKNKRLVPTNALNAIERLKIICRSSQPMLSALCRIQSWGNYEKHRVEVMEVLSSMPWGQYRTVPDSRWADIGSIFGNDRYANCVSCLPWAVAAQIEAELHLYTGDGVVPGTKRLLRTWLAATRHHHNGRSPLSTADLPLQGLAFHHGIWNMAEEVDWKEDADKLHCETGWDELTMEFGNDLWFLIGILQKLHYEILAISTYYEPGTGKFAKEVFLRWRREAYLQVVAAAFEEGYDELANAFLAFGIFSQALIGYSIAGWPKRYLRDLIDRSKNKPSGAMVRRAIAIAASVETHEEHSLSNAWLASFVDEILPDQISPRPVGLSRRQIEQSCQRFIGEECWIWLLPETKRCLVEAEVIYSKCHLEIGTDIRDLRSLTIGYCIAIEAELVGRFKDVFNSTEFTEHQIEHRRDKQSPTLGTVVYLIETFSKLKPAMQARMKASCLLAHEDVELVKWLQFFRNTRNKSAHPEKFDNADFMTIRDRSMQIYRRLKAKLT